MDVKTWKWSTRKSYPYAPIIYGARSLYYGESFIVFGGRIYVNNAYENFKRIAAYTPKFDSWTEIGSMLSGRSDTSVINFGEEFLIIGAYYLEHTIDGDRQSEKFAPDGGTMISQYQAPYMADSGKNNISFSISNFYLGYYHAFPISENYCATTKFNNLTKNKP